MRKLRVGVFDSGLGGLSVLAACARRTEGVVYGYLGDNANAPYGSKPPEEILSLTRKGVKLLLDWGADAIVLACNTATAVCAEKLRGELSVPVLGTEPAVLPAARACRNILVLATPRTAESERLRRLLARCPDARFTVCPLPRLAAAIERYAAGGEPVSLEAHLPRGNFDGIVLGCTHYSLLSTEISAFYKAPVFDGGEGVARRLVFVLDRLAEHFSGSKLHNSIELNNIHRREVFPQKMNKNRIFFLGMSKKINKRVYKHMFINIF